MRELIAERPNTVPSGLGNSSSGMDVSILGQSIGPSSDDDGDGDGSSTEWDLKAFDDLNETGYLGNPSDEDFDADDTVMSTPAQDNHTGGTHLKRKASTPISLIEQEKKPHVGKTAARPGTSAAAKPTKHVKKSKKEEFSEIVQAEELTRQKELDVAKARAEKDKVKAQTKLAKLELEREKLMFAREKMKMKQADKRMAGLGGENRNYGLSADTHSETFDFQSLSPLSPSMSFTQGNSLSSVFRESHYEQPRSYYRNASSDLSFQSGHNTPSLQGSQLEELYGEDEVVNGAGMRLPSGGQDAEDGL